MLVLATPLHCSVALQSVSAVQTLRQVLVVAPALFVHMAPLSQALASPAVSQGSPVLGEALQPAIQKEKNIERMIFIIILLICPQSFDKLPG